MAVGTGSLISAGLSLGSQLLGAKKQKSAAKAAAAAGTPTPWSVSGPGGMVGMDPRSRQITMSMGNNPFASMFNVLGAQGFANAGAGAGEIQDAYSGLYGGGLTDQIQQHYNLLNQIAAPEENRQRLALDDQLYSRGQLGTSGGAERFRGLSEAQLQADLQRQLAAVGLGQDTARTRFEAAMRNQAQQFDVGQGAFNGLNTLFNQLMQQGQLGVGAGSGTPPQLAQGVADARMAPYQAGYNFLNNTGAFDRFGQMFGGRPQYQLDPGGPIGVPNLGPINIGAPDPASWMPTVGGF